MSQIILPVQLRGGPGKSPVVSNLPIGVNTWTQIQLQVNSTDWNTIDGLQLGYAAQMSIDGGVTWVDWGGFTAVSPTFMKDGTTKVEPGGIWDWDPSFHNGGTLKITVTCPTAFNWGATITLT